jgi:hypothetical protein
MFFFNLECAIWRFGSFWLGAQKKFLNNARSYELWSLSWKKIFFFSISTCQKSFFFLICPNMWVPSFIYLTYISLLARNVINLLRSLEISIVSWRIFFFFFLKKIDFNDVKFKFKNIKINQSSKFQFGFFFRSIIPSDFKEPTFSHSFFFLWKNLMITYRLLIMKFFLVSFVIFKIKF